MDITSGIVLLALVFCHLHYGRAVVHRRNQFRPDAFRYSNVDYGEPNAERSINDDTLHVNPSLFGDEGLGEGSYNDIGNYEGNYLESSLYPLENDGSDYDNDIGDNKFIGFDEEITDEDDDLPLGIPNANLFRENKPGRPLTGKDFDNAEFLVEISPLNDNLAADPIELAGEFEGDILGFNRSVDIGRNAMKDTGRRWTDSIIPYVISSAFSKDERSRIAKAFTEYHKKTCIRFVPRSKEKDHLYFLKGSGCSSHVGRQGGMQQVSLGTGCMYTGIITHELMHAVGFWHEQSRPDRDEHIEILWDNIVAGMDYNFKKFGWSHVESLGQKYDLKSVMHYGPFAFSRNPSKPTIMAKGDSAVRFGQRDGFSEIDVRKINRLYGCKDVSILTTTASPISAGKPLSDNCKDKSQHCPYWAETGECKRNPVWMDPYCRRSCEKCDKPTVPTTPSARVVNSRCVDVSNRCGQWASQGECKRNPVYMNDYCKYSCKKC